MWSPLLRPHALAPPFASCSATAPHVVGGLQARLFQLQPHVPWQTDLPLRKVFAGDFPLVLLPASRNLPGQQLPRHRWSLLSNWATHEVPPWKIVWMLFFNKGLIRHLIWETLHFKALTQTLLSKVKGPALAKEMWRKGFVLFFNPKSGCSQ